MDTFTADIEVLEPHQLDRRFASLRLPDPKAVEALERSIALAGQLQPLIAVPAEQGTERCVLLDGYRRLEALGRLRHDTAVVAIWRCSLADALPRVLAQAQARAWAPVEEALTLHALTTDYGLSQHELARRSGRDVSWVNRRLKLLGALSDELLEAICAGQLSTWAAARILTPLARANEAHARALLDALAEQPMATRDLARWYQHYNTATRATREYLVAHPHLFVAALHNEAAEHDAERLRQGPEGQWRITLDRITAQLERLRQALPKLCAEGALPAELALAVERTRSALEALDQEIAHHDASSDRR